MSSASVSSRVGLPGIRISGSFDFSAETMNLVEDFHLHGGNGREVFDGYILI
jgi:hypothetical protein